tara:strand:- start:1252 stop:1569 length:318 start_codon:yes stop_codon:yes gene_type:complete
LPKNGKMFKRQKESIESLAGQILNSGTDTCILKIRLIGVSKVMEHFLYECVYLDLGVLKTVPVVAKDVTHVINILSPYIKKGKSEQWTAFHVGSENAVLSRMKKN